MEKYTGFIKEKWTSILVWIYITLAIYVTVIPFSFTNDSTIINKHLHNLHWLPDFFYGHIISGADTLLNILFFIPLGILLGVDWLMQHHQKYPARVWFLIILRGMALSLFVEFLQIFTYNRNPSTTDLTNNLIGTVFGAYFIQWIYLKYHVQIKGAIKHILWHKPEMIMSAIIFPFIILIEFAPFNIYLNRLAFSERWRMFLDHPFVMDQSFISEALVQVSLYGIWMFYFYRGLRIYFPEVKIKYRSIIIVAVIFLPLVLEVFQFSLPDRRHSLVDILPAWAGMIFGWRLAKLQLKNSVGQKELWRKPGCFYQADKKYLGLFSALYGVFFVYHSFIYPFKVWAPDRLFLKWRLFTDFVNWIVNADRLQILIDFFSLLLIFLPVGFFAFYYLKKKLVYTYQKVLLILATVILVMIVVFFRLLSGDTVPHISLILAGFAGVWFGAIFENIHEYLFSESWREY